MRSYATSLFTKTASLLDPTPLKLLDLSLLVVLIPIIMIAKLPMLLFMFVVTLVLTLQKRSARGTILLAFASGASAIFLSLYGEFNFAGLSRLKLFVELLIYTLIVAISLQRLKREINIYLIISPILLLALSLFFFNSITMLLYVVFEIFTLLWMILTHRMGGGYLKALRVSVVIFISSIPVVVLLFLLFPRISFEHASFGFKGDVRQMMGHDGTMFIDGNALLVPSSKIVMEVEFQNKIPPAKQLYFRGSVLYTLSANQWTGLKESLKKDQNISYEKADNLTLYKVSLYPTHKRWLYLLDLPTEAPSGSVIDSDFEVKLPKIIDDPQHYEAASALNYRYGAKTSQVVLTRALEYKEDSNPLSQKLASELSRKFKDQGDRAEAIEKVFKDANLTYTLKPDLLDLNNSVDSFLFDKKRGYCVHFASAYATFARMSNIASRVVTGYKSDGTDSVNNYLVVRELDAHAWVELLIDGSWRRVETTTTASHFDLQSQQTSINGAENNYIEDINLYLMYLKYQVESWILEYSYLRQMQLLERAKEDTVFVVKMIASFTLVVLFSLIVVRYFNRPETASRVEKIVALLLVKLHKNGYTKEPRDTLHTFLLKCAKQSPHSKELMHIDMLYEKFRYCDDADMLDELERCVKNYSSKRVL